LELSNKKELNQLYILQDQFISYPSEDSVVNQNRKIEKILILDTETTGLDVKDGHRIVEIGCLEIDNYVLTSKKFHCYLNPERKVSEKALEVHGYSDEFLSNKKKFRTNNKYC